MYILLIQSNKLPKSLLFLPAEPKNDMKQIAILKKIISPQMEHPDFSGVTKTQRFTKIIMLNF